MEMNFNLVCLRFSAKCITVITLTTVWSKCFPNEMCKCHMLKVKRWIKSKEICATQNKTNIPLKEANCGKRILS